MLVKLIAISTGTIAGALGLSSPLIHIGVTSSSYEKKWHIKNNFADPILKDCKASNGKHYTLFLEFDSGGEKHKEHEVFFRVEETSGSWDKAIEKKVVWSKNKSTDQQAPEWKKWKLDKRTENTLDFMYPELESIGAWERFGKTTCDANRKIKPSSSRSFGEGHPIEVSEIKLTLAKGSSCRKYFASVECDLKIEANDKLKWDENFKPKIIYSPF